MHHQIAFIEMSTTVCRAISDVPPTHMLAVVPQLRASFDASSLPARPWPNCRV